jgi:uncharacterized protein (TIGR03083 family)
METERLLTCLADDYARLRDVAARDLAASVPSCPGWTVTDLVRHVAEVYLHKVHAMEHNDWPRDWPPDFAGEAPLALLERAYGELAAQFGARDPGDPAKTWYEPDQTVGFWIRRMAQETVIHRLDGELAAAEPLAPIPDDLAVDGIDEVLVIFLDYGSHRWREEFASVLKETAGAPVRIAVDPPRPGASWLVSNSDAGVDARPDGSGAAVATVSGRPDALLRWLWGRGADAAVAVSGDPGAATDLRRALTVATQ